MGRLDDSNGTSPNLHLLAAEYLRTDTALRLLGVKPQTLYAYVSRGWIRRVQDKTSNRSLYSRVDIERIKARADARAGHAAVAAAAMRWGEPIMHSAITAIGPMGPSYRGVAATELIAAGHSFETLIGRLWEAPVFQTSGDWRLDRDTLSWIERTASILPVWRDRHSMRFLATIASLFDDRLPPRAAAHPGSAIREARALLLTLTASLSHRVEPKSVPDMTSPSLARRILLALGGLPKADCVTALDAALIHCADHELSQTTFVARISASAGADLGSCLSAAILSMPSTGARRSPARTELFLNSVVAAADPREAFKIACKGGQGLPGFNHPLYPKGDPRGRALVDIVRRLPRSTAKADRLLQVFDLASSELGYYASFDAGLAALAAVLGLRESAVSELYVIARCAGWIAHVLEQRALNLPLRPRAKYVGESARMSLSCPSARY